jgi:hypothetical protein
MQQKTTKDFSVVWVVVSFFVFMAVELFFGYFVGEVLLGAYVSSVWHAKAQLILILSSFLVGGFLVGFFSPGLRLVEPAVGAFSSVLFVGLMKYFLPYSFFGFNNSNLFIGGVLAFVLAWVGAYSAEKLMRNVEG